MTSSAAHPPYDADDVGWMDGWMNAAPPPPPISAPSHILRSVRFRVVPLHTLLQYGFIEFFIDLRLVGSLPLCSEGFIWRVVGHGGLKELVDAGARMLTWGVSRDILP